MSQTKTPEQMSDSQLLLTIRQIESSPSAHRTAKVAALVDENLRALRAEAQRRRLTY